jgi:hypothetical protein
MIEKSWQCDFAPTTGAKGERKKIGTVPASSFIGHMGFQPLKMIVTDSARKESRAVKILSLRSGVEGTEDTFTQSSGESSMITHFDLRAALCKAGDTILLEVEFLEDCTMDLTIFGKMT